MGWSVGLHVDCPCGGHISSWPARNVTEIYPKDFARKVGHNNAQSIVCSQLEVQLSSCCTVTGPLVQELKTNWAGLKEGGGNLFYLQLELS